MNVAEGIRAKVAILMGILAIVAIASTFSAVYTLYNSAIDVKKEHLASIVERHAYLIKSLSKQDNDPDSMGSSSTISKKQAEESIMFSGEDIQDDGFARSGELVIGRRLGDEIEYLYSYQSADEENNEIITSRTAPWETQLSQPLKRALSGESGTIIGLDYMGRTVLAAYTPIEGSDWGIVAKIDLAEVQRPFVNVAVYSSAALFLIIILAYSIFRIVSNPFLDKKKTEDELVELNKQMRAILDNTADGILSISEDGTILTFNRSAEKIFRYSASEIIGKNVAILMTGFDAGRHDSYVRSYLKTDKPKIIGIGPREVNGVRKDGSPVPIDLAVNSVKSDGRNIFVGSMRDISDRMVRRMRLQRTQKIEAIGQLTGGVAHDFENILRNIQDNLDKLDAKIGDDSDVKEYINDASRASKHGSEMIQRLLTFARRQKPTSESINISELISDTLKLAEPSLGLRIKVVVNIARDLWSIVTDKGQLENALLGLYLNAKDAMPEGGDLTIEAENLVLDKAKAKESDVLPGEYISIHVIDTGIGMSEEVLGKIFQPFYTTKDFGKGSGLGLSIIHGFVTQTGGSIKIGSKLGKGSTVEILLPRHGQSSSN